MVRKKSENKYVADLSINKFKIDEEILKQAQLYYEWSYKAGVAEVDRDNAKDYYDLVIIETEKRIRKHPDLFFGDKTPTEAAIKNKVLSNKNVKAALQAYNKARNEFKLLAKAEKAFEQRKRMIECYLWRINKGQESDVKVPRTFQDRLRKEMKEDIQNDLSKTLKRR